MIQIMVETVGKQHNIQSSCGVPVGGTNHYTKKGETTGLYSTCDIYDARTVLHIRRSVSAADTVNKIVC